MLSASSFGKVLRFNTSPSAIKALQFSSGNKQHKWRLATRPCWTRGTEVGDPECKALRYLFSADSQGISSMPYRSSYVFASSRGKMRPETKQNMIPLPPQRKIRSRHAGSSPSGAINIHKRIKEPNRRNAVNLDPVCSACLGFLSPTSHNSARKRLRSLSTWHVSSVTKSQRKGCFSGQS